jgi:hypothetical protein
MLLGLKGVPQNAILLKSIVVEWDFAVFLWSLAD